jgi:5-methylthioadenosine/S-adenosylhomocysteine deaminase
LPLFAGVEEWTPRLVYLSALLGTVEMLKSGTTAVLDHLWTPQGVASPYLDAAMQAYYDVGIRAAVAPAIEDQDLVQDAALAHGLSFPVHPFIDRFAADEVALREEILERCATVWPGFPALRDRVAHTHEVQATFDALSRILLRGEKVM